jgi:hypothetical protein
MMQTNGKTNDAGLTFSPAFRYSGISTFYHVKIVPKQAVMRQPFVPSK